MSKKISDFFSVPLNTAYTSGREIGRGLRDQLLPEKVSDIFSRVFTSIDDKPLLDSSQPHLGVVIRMFQPLGTTQPPVGSMPWIRNQEKGSTQSESEISSICYVASYDRVNLFNTLPENRGAARTKKDQILESDLILAYVEGDPIKDKTITEGSVVQIQFVSWPKEARIIAVQDKNTPFPATGPDGAQNAFGESDGTTLGDSLLPVGRINYLKETVCKNASGVTELANEIGIDPAVLAAFRTVESGGNPTAVRFEPHLFNARSSTKVPFTKSSGVSFSKVASETNRSAFERAYKINKRLAIESSSFGLYQVVIVNATSIFDDPRINNEPDKFVKLFNENPLEISNLLVKAWFKGNKTALEAANELNFRLLAQKYNGRQYAANQYDIKLQSAYQAAKTKCREYSEPSAGLGASSYVQGLQEQPQSTNTNQTNTNNGSIIVRQGGQ